MTGHQHKEPETDSCLSPLPKDIRLLIQSLKLLGSMRFPKRVSWDWAVGF